MCHASNCAFSSKGREKHGAHLGLGNVGMGEFGNEKDIWSTLLDVSF